MNVLNKILLAILIIGGLNWGLIGLFQFDLVAAIFGGMSSVMSRIIYTIVGLCGLYCISMLFYPSLTVEAEDEPEPELS